jgi:hypothetical protein
MSDRLITELPPLRMWLPSETGFSRADVVVSSLEIAAMPGGGVAILQYREGQVSWRLDLPGDVARAVAARIVAAAGLMRRGQLRNEVVHAATPTVDGDVAKQNVIREGVDGR